MTDASKPGGRGKPDWGAIVIGVLFSILWSSAFSTGKLIVADAPPFLALAVRFLLAGFIGIGLAFALGQRIELKRREWIAVLVLGLCQNTLYLGFCFLAFERIDASMVVILASLLPLLVAGANRAFFGVRLGSIGLIGLMAGVAGVLVIMQHRLSQGSDPVGIGMTLIGVTALAAATLLVGNAFGRNRNMLMIVGLQMLVGGVSLAVLSVLLEAWVVNWTIQLLVAFTWTTLAPGLLATLLWFQLVGRIGATRAATFHFLNPFFGVAIAALLLGEQLATSDVVGVGIIMVAILAVQLGGLPASEHRDKPGESK